jgi:predicted MFS family arabinose efflux permease
VLVASNVLSGGAQLVAAVLLLTGTATLWQLVLTQLVRGVAQSFFFPASTGLVPQTVPDEKLQQANVLLRMTTNGSFVLGAAAGGILVAAVGSGWALAFDGGTYLVSGAILVFMRIGGRVRASTGFAHELREGWRAFRSREWLWAIVAAATFGNMISQGCWAVLGPVVAQRELGGARAWGLVLAAQSIGFLAGGIAAFRLRPRRYLLTAQAVIVFSAVNLVALALGVPVAVLAVAAFVTGFCVELFGVYWDTALQQHVPREALSRVSSYDALGSIVAIPVGLSIVGPVSAAIGVGTTLWAGAILFTLVQAAALLSRDVRTLARTDQPVAVDPSPEPEAVTAS